MSSTVMMMMMMISVLLFFTILVPPSTSFSNNHAALVVRSSLLTSLSAKKKSDDLLLFTRTDVLTTLLTTATATTTAALVLVPGPAQAVVQRAVGSAEESCRTVGNCLERGDWDGAVGWNWGAKNRCDATDPRCGADGRLRERNVAPVPSSSLALTHVVSMDLTIGRSGEGGTLRLGLYGTACPKSVRILLNDIISIGNKSSSPSTWALTTVYPNQRVDFGIFSQQVAYAKTLGLTKAPDNFVPRPKPTTPSLTEEPPVRGHDQAGLVSVEVNSDGGGLFGIIGGAAGNGSKDDEALVSAVTITATADASLDRNRRVVGQVMDRDGMALLARLSSLSAKKGFKGIVPGQNYGPPLLKVAVTKLTVTEVVPPSSNTSISSAATATTTVEDSSGAENSGSLEDSSKLEDTGSVENS